MSDYSISWGYIVSRMESLYGISPNSNDKVAYGEIEQKLKNIWQEYFERLYAEDEIFLPSRVDSLFKYRNGG